MRNIIIEIVVEHEERKTCNGCRSFKAEQMIKIIHRSALLSDYNRQANINCEKISLNDE